jgi:hypothetical protein
MPPALCTMCHVSFRFESRGSFHCTNAQHKKIQLVTDLITTDEAIIKRLTKEDIEELLG